MATDSRSDRSSTRRRGGDRWQRNLPAAQRGRAVIESGDSGIFLTCDMGREDKCIAEALDLFSQSVELYSDAKLPEEPKDSYDDIETQIEKEVESLKPKSTSSSNFQAIKLDTPCLAFMRVDKSVDPVQLVHRLCAEAQAKPEQKKSRWIKRMTPVTAIHKILNIELAEFAKEILQSHFHAGEGPKKYAIRPTIRNNQKIKRDDIIKTIANIVGSQHTVDLGNYDLIILVDVFQNMIGMSVVGSDYDKLKRFNLAEIYSPTPVLPVLEPKNQPPQEE